MGIRNQIQDNINKTLHELRRVERVEQYIADNLQTDLSAATVAAKFELSVSSLQHLFKRHQQQTYQHYLQDIRIAKAFELVKEGKRIKEIMYATGYKYRTTFNKAFKKKLKHPPGYFKE